MTLESWTIGEKEPGKLTIHMRVTEQGSAISAPSPSLAADRLCEALALLPSKYAGVLDSDGLRSALRDQAAARTETTLNQLDRSSVMLSGAIADADYSISRRLVADLAILEQRTVFFAQADGASETTLSNIATRCRRAIDALAALAEAQLASDSLQAAERQALLSEGEARRERWVRRLVPPALATQAWAAAPPPIANSSAWARALSLLALSALTAAAGGIVLDRIDADPSSQRTPVAAVDRWLATIGVLLVCAAVLATREQLR
ncbi:MAG: hypothetical protein DHS20C19_13910 [Acidimicrobiales bacterium]|nr:MAG: hypothetical protein DHS20C19_13910 [Acidimicrobiales bacterium]